MSANPAPGFKKHPDNRIVTKPAGVRVQVKLKGELIADSRDAIVLEEGSYPPVFYFPRRDVAFYPDKVDSIATHGPA